MDVEVLSASANFILSASDRIGDLLVAESELLGFEHELLLDAVQGPNVF